MHVKTDALLEEIDRLEFIVTDSVVEALALENNLIKTRNPKYNIRLRDDKNYPYLQLTTGERFPRVLVARRVERDGHVYAGPFLPARLARRTMALTHRLFGIRSCNEVITGKRARPCLEYDIKRCIAPCVDTICTEAQYQQAVHDTRLFLEGRTEELARDLRGRMQDASQGERYEEAAQLRDAVLTVETLAERHQKMATPDLGARDVFGLRMGSEGAVVQVFQVRSGRVVDRVELVTEAGEAAMTPKATCSLAALTQFYETHPAPPGDSSAVGGGRGRGARSLAGRACRAPRAAGRAASRREEGTARPRRAQRLAGLRRALQCADRGQLRGARDAAHGAGAFIAAAAYRLLRHLDDSGQRDRCVDGGLRRRADAKERVQEVPYPRRRATASSSTTSLRCTRWSSGATAACWRKAARFRT